MSESQEGLKHLHELFVSLFSPDELKRFLAYGPEGKQLSNSLLGLESTLGNLAYSAIDALERHGLIEQKLFNRLLVDFPGRCEDISRVAQEWGIVLKRVGQPPPPEAEAPKPVAKPPADEVETKRRHLSQKHAALLVERARELEEGGDDARLQNIARQIEEAQREIRAGPQVQVGAVLGQRYKLKKVLGNGGFAVVFEAVDWHENKTVAVKVLHPNLGDNGEIRDRFFRGARSMDELAGHGVVRVTDRGGSDRGYHYFAMELLRGRFRAVIETEFLSLRGRLDLVRQVGKTLEAAHARGIIHRDIRPDNILMDGDSRPCLTDFDIALSLHETRYTQISLMGNIVYSAPEQLKDPRDATERSDIYSLAMLAVYAILREDPDLAAFQRDRYLFIEHLNCPLEVKQLLARALSLRPRDRFYASVSDFCSDFDLALTAIEVEFEGGHSFVSLDHLMRLSDNAFNAQVAWVEAEINRSSAGRQWQARRGPRSLRAVDLLSAARTYGINVEFEGGETGPVFSNTRKFEKSSDLDWERTFEILCELAPGDFQAFLFVFPRGNEVSDPGAARIQRVKQILQLARSSGPSVLYGLVREFRQRFELFPDRVVAKHPMAQEFWARARLRSAVDELDAAIPDAHEACWQMRHAISSREYGELEQLLRNMQRWRTFPLQAAQWIGRIHSLLMEVPKSLRRGLRRECRHSPFRHAEMYRTLCRLEADEWESVRSEFVVVSASPDFACRAMEVQVFMSQVVTVSCDALYRRLKQNSAYELPSIRFELHPCEIDTLIDELEGILQRELFMYCDRQWNESKSWKEMLKDIRTVDEDRPRRSYIMLRQEFVGVCGLGDPLRALVGEMAKEKSRGIFNVLRRKYTIEDMHRVIAALQIPSWYRQPGGISFLDLLDSLTSFLMFLNIPGACEAHAEMEPEEFIGWIHIQRVASS